MAGTLAIQLRNLKVFCDVIDRRSFSLAAADNGLTQSAVSQCIQQLEEIIGTRLIDRSKRPPLPTAEGQRFYEGCGKILRQYETLVEEIQSFGSELCGRVKVASIYSVGLSYLPPLLEQFQNLNPKVQVQFQFEQPDEVYRLVERGAADFGLVSYPYPTKTIAMQPWRDESMVLVASAKSRWTNGEAIDAEGLSRIPMIAFLPHLRIRQEIDRRMRALGVVPKVVAELDNIDSVKHAVLVNTGVAFVPEPTIRNEVANRQLTVLPCPLVELSRPLGIIQRRNSTLGASARSFLELLLRDAGVTHVPGAGKLEPPGTAVDAAASTSQTATKARDAGGSNPDVNESASAEAATDDAKADKKAAADRSKRNRSASLAT